MALHAQWEDHELPKLQELLQRALNTWDPKDAPKWAWELDAKVQVRITDLKFKAQEKVNGTVNAGT